MKKVLVFISIFVIFTLINKNVNANSIIIPSKAIRFRVFANSNNVYDQEVKMNVVNSVQNDIYKLLKDEKDIDIARTMLKQNIPRIESIVEKTLKEKKAINTFKVEYGYNYFPEKNFQNIKYPAGNYESLLITIGEGKGNNWWCVLFPPLCLLEAEDSNTVEYKFYIQELIEKYL